MVRSRPNMALSGTKSNRPWASLRI